MFNLLSLLSVVSVIVMVACLIVALIMIIGRAGGPARSWGVAAIVILLIGSLSSAVLNPMLPVIAQALHGDASLLYGINSILHALIWVAGIVCLVLSVVAATAGPSKEQSVWNR